MAHLGASIHRLYHLNTALEHNDSMQQVNDVLRECQQALEKWHATTNDRLPHGRGIRFSSLARAEVVPIPLAEPEHRRLVHASRLGGEEGRL